MPHPAYVNRDSLSLPRRVARAVYEQAAYLGLRSAIAAATVLPPARMVDLASWMGRTYASMNRRRLGRAMGNLAVAYPQLDEEERHEIAVASHEHLFRFGVELAYSPRLLTEDSWFDHLNVGDLLGVAKTVVQGGPCVLITGHCGNWEMLGYTMALLGFPVHAVYRPLDLPQMDRWVRGTRSRRGLTLVDKFGAIRVLPQLMGAGAPVGFVADQNGGDRGIFVPFFNRLASSYKSIALLARRFNATVGCAYARRMPDAKPGTLGYRIECTDLFGPAEWNTHPDPVFYITARYRRAIETMIHKAPEQYLWMHRIWRSRPRHERSQRPFPAALEEKIRLLPWITDEDMERIKDHSVRDARLLLETGQDKLS